MLQAPHPFSWRLVPMPEPRIALAVIPDLFSAAKVAATARAAGVALTSASPADAAGKAAEIRPGLVLVDLHVPDAVATVAALARATPPATIVGFFSHVE